MKSKDTFRSCLAPDIVRYIALKQALGRRFDTASWILFWLDRFLCSLGEPASDLTAETFNQWCQTMERLSANSKLARMRVVRHFCLYRRRTVPGCFVPDPTQFPQAIPRVAPYIFTDAEVARLLSHSAAIADSVRSPLRGAATRLAIILLYTAGLRRGELLRLSAQDYDASAQTLLIRASKFHKSRLLPLAADVAAEVTQFLVLRAAVQPPLPAAAPLIWNPYCGGRAYCSIQLRKNLHILLNLAGIQKSDGRRPRIHDFRFSFAVNALIRWYRNGADVQAKLPFLAAYMGHVSVLSTYYYLRFVEPLRSLASKRFADSYGALVTAVSEQKGAQT
jgi:integrase/recombinase XerD